MRKLVASVWVYVACATAAHAAAVTINLSAGQMFLPNGAPVPDGRLVQLIVSTADATFTAPTGLSFVGGSFDDVVVASFLLDSTTAGVPGTFSRPIVLDYGQLYDGKSIGAGMPLLLRFWPNIQNVSATNPSVDPVAMLGQFRRDTIADFSDIAWFLPGAPSTKSLNVLTGHPLLGGSTPNSALTVPEPSTALLTAFGFLGLSFRRERPKRRVRSRP